MGAMETPLHISTRTQRFVVPDFGGCGYSTANIHLHTERMHYDLCFVSFAHSAVISFRVCLLQGLKRHNMCSNSALVIGAALVLTEWLLPKVKRFPPQIHRIGRSVGRLIGLIGVIRKCAIKINQIQGFYKYLYVFICN